MSNSWLTYVRNTSRETEQPYNLCMITQKGNYKKQGHNMNAVVIQYYKFLRALNGTFHGFVDTKTIFDSSEIHDFHTLIEQIQADFANRI